MLNYDITLQLQDCMHTIKYVVHTNLYCMFDELFFSYQRRNYNL